MSKNQANNIISYFCNYLEIAPKSFDAENKIELNLDDDIGVIIQYVEEMNSILFNLLICPVQIGDNESRNELLYDILCGNYLWGYTGGGTLGIDKKTQLLCLSRLVEVLEDSQAECNGFLDVFASLAGAARYWRDYVSGVETISPSSNELPILQYIRV